MYDILLSLHSLLRWALLVLLLIVIVRSFKGWMGKLPFAPLDNKLKTFTVIAAHVQLLTGFVLYFVSPMVQSGLSAMSVAMKDKILRFWTVEHVLMMVIAIALITVGSSMSKRASDDTGKHKKLAIFFLIGLLLILASIPWPFMQTGSGRGWI